MSFFSEALDALSKSGLYRSLTRIDSPQCGRVSIDGRDVLLLCSNNYLGLADHPRLKEAAISATSEYGAGSGASRLVSGNMLLHEELEKKIAAFKSCEAAILFNSGYSANVGVIQALATRDDTIYSDRLNHASIVDGAILSRARLVRFPHRDARALRRLLDRHKGKGRSLIVTDGVFSMDGDIAPLREIAALCKEYNALLMVDDAHGTAVMGQSGRGSAELLGVSDQIDVHMGTLGKGLGSFGAYVAGSAEMVDYLRNRARSFIFSTSLPPSVLAASIAAIEIVQSPEGERLRGSLESNRALFSGLLAKAGFDTLNSPSQIIPIIVGGTEETMKFSRLLFEQGVFVQGIRPPTVPAGECRLRCTVMATHSVSDLEEAAARIIETGHKVGLV
jgi:glycine C-acetyltransferase